MLDGLGPAPDLTLLFAPEDRVEFVAFGDWRMRCGRRQASLLYVVHHASCGGWSSACRVVRDGRPGHLSVVMETTREGDARDELRGWLQARLREMAPR